MKQIFAILTIILTVLSANAQETYKDLTVDEWIEKAKKTWKKKEQATYLKNAAMMDSPRGQYEYAKHLSLYSQKKRSFSFYMQSAQQGYAPAQYEVGVIYDFLKGYGVRPNKDSAIYWYLKASEQNYEEAFFKLGRIYEHTNDYSNAAIWYDKAVNNIKQWKHKRDKYYALYILGKIYEGSYNNMTPDYVKAYNYYVATDVDDNNSWSREDAQKGIARLKPIVTKIISEQKIPEFEKQYGNSKDPEKLFELANLYTAIEKYDKSFFYLRKAAQLGHTEAMYNTGFLYHVGQGTTKDVTKAVYWYKKAAEKNHSDAMNMYYDGDGILQDYKTAVTYLRKAAALNNGDACANLGLCYEEGYGVTKNMEEALKWYKKASDLGNQDGANRYAELTYPAQTTTTSTTTSSQRSGGGFWNPFVNITSKAAEIMEGVASIYESTSAYNQTSTQNESYTGNDNNNGAASSGYSVSVTQGGYRAKVMCEKCYGTGKLVDNNPSKCQRSDCKSYFCSTCYRKHCSVHLKHQKCTWGCDGKGYIEKTVYEKPCTNCGVCHNVGFVAEFTCHGNKTNCEYAKCPLCGKKHCLQHDRHKRCVSCNGTFALDTYADNDFAAKSDYVAPTKIDCKYCYGTGQCQECNRRYFTDQNGKKYGANEHWRDNIARYMCDNCNKWEIATCPDGVKRKMDVGIYGNWWKTVAPGEATLGVLCFSCDGTMKCPYCNGTGDSNKNNW